MENDSGSAGAGNPGASDAGAGQDPAGGSPWYSGIQDAELRGWSENKNFATPDAAMAAYRNLEQVFGAEKAGNTVVLPKDGAEPQELDDFYNRLGRPESADKYELEIGDNADQDFVGWFKSKAHERGLTQKQAAQFAKDYQDYSVARAEAAHADGTAKLESEIEALDKEWGAAREQKFQLGRNAAKEFGMDVETIDRLQDVLGYTRTMKFFADIGQKIGEGSGVADAGSRSGTFETMTPEAATVRIGELMADKDWAAAYTGGSRVHLDQMSRLQRMAAGKK